ncbi:hypothetical protein ACJMK2_026776 [Sinanodonta woodiana]|uniref:Chitin-binding type-2 domain-containing protein n=1 Tax=Sinanodonta woodiana TaxID=1069815 RepID=A0ABD3XP24_SINWO
METFDITIGIIIALLPAVVCSTSTNCEDTCVGKADGNYQYCPDCHHYMICIDEYEYIMPCPSSLVWDDHKKMCYWTSSTCNTLQNGTSIHGCDDSCVGKGRGFYQYCHDCHQYVLCIDGYKYVMPCPSDLEWDDMTKMCNWTSSTCRMSKSNHSADSLSTGKSNI